MPDEAAGTGETASIIPFPSKEAPKPPSAERAREVAFGLVDRRRKEVTRSFLKTSGDSKFIDVESMNEDQYNLHAIELFKVGLDYKTAGDEGYKLKGGLDVTTKDGQSVTINSLVGETEETDGKVYKAKAEIDDEENPGNKKTIEVDVDAAEIVRSHKEKHAASIAKNFTDPVEASLVEWYAKGGEGEVPESVVSLLEEDKSPVEQVDGLINEVISSLRDEIGDLKAITKPSREQRTDLADKEALIGRLNLYLEMDGKNFAEFSRYLSLEELKRQGIKGLGEMQNLLRPKAKEAYDTLKQKLKDEGGATDKELDELTTHGFAALANNKDLLAKLAKVEGLDVMMFGKTLTSAEFMEKFGSTLTKDQKEWLEKNGGGLGGGLLAVLLILIATPVMALGGATVAATSLAQMGGRRAG